MTKTFGSTPRAALTGAALALLVLAAGCERRAPSEVPGTPAPTTTPPADTSPATPSTTPSTSPATPGSDMSAPNPAASAASQ